MGKPRASLKIAISLAFTWSALVFAESPALAQAEHTKGGAEFTVTNAKVKAGKHWDDPDHINPQSSANRKAINDIFTMYKSYCRTRRPNCSVKQGVDKYGNGTVELTFPEHKLTAVFQPDVQVVEITMTPIDFRTALKIQPVVQGEIFDLLKKNFDLAPDVTEGGGHVSIDFGVFSNNTLLLLNFITDYANHPELAREPTEDATHFADLPPEARKAFGKIVEDIRAEQMQGKITTTPAQLAKRIYNEVYNYAAKLAGHDPTEFEWVSSNMALNLESITNLFAAERTKRVEDRSVPPQLTYRQFIEEMAIKLARIDYLATIKEVIPYQDPQKQTDAQKWQSFEGYVEQSGLDIDDVKEVAATIVKDQSFLTKALAGAGCSRLKNRYGELMKR